MRKIIHPLFLVCIFSSLLHAQAPNVWQTYYSKYGLNGFADNGNSLVFTQTTQLVQFDKASGFFQYTPIPYSVLPCNSDHNPNNVGAEPLVAGPTGNIWMTTIIGNQISNVSSPGSTYWFDGTNWNSFAPTLQGAGLEPNLLPTFDRQGNMWFASPSHGLVKYSNNIFINWDTTNSSLASQDFMTAFVFDQNNNLWVGTDSGVVKFDGVNFTRFSFAAMGATDFAYYDPYELCISPGGTVYVFEQFNGVYNYYTYNGTGWTVNNIDTSVTGGGGTGLESIFFDSLGNTYFGFDIGIFQYSGGVYTFLESGIAFMPETDAAGTVWMDLNGSLTSFSGGNFTSYQDPRGVLESNIMLPQILDKQGNQWLGFWGGGGLDKRTGYTFSAPITQANAVGYVDAFTLDSAGMVWFGVDPLAGPAATYPINYINPANNAITSIPENASCDLNSINGITINKHNQIYIAAFSRCSGFATIVDDTIQMLPFPFTNQSLPVMPSCITADSSNNIWIGTSSNELIPISGVGVVKYDGTNFTDYNPSNSGIPDSNIQSLGVDPSGRLWVGTFNYGFSIFNGTTWTNYDSLNSPLPCNHVEWFYFANGKTFIATQMGFCVFDGTNWTTYTPQNSGLVDGDCESIVVDAQCNVWAATECGLSQLVGECNNSLKVLYGKVTSQAGSPVVGTEVLLMKLDNTTGILTPIDNTVTDAQGNYSFATAEPTVYVHAEPNSRINTTVYAGYEDTAFVQQQATPVQMTGGVVNSNVTLYSQVLVSGVALNGTVANSWGGYPGGVHLYLVQNGIPVSTAMVGVDGSFAFSNIASGTYSIWVDKMEVNNASAPTIHIGNANGYITTMLYPSYLQILTTAISPLASNTGLSIYPNPSSGKFNFMPNPDMADGAVINIYNISSQVVYAGRVGAGLQTLDLSALANGVYLARLVTPVASYNEKIIIQK